MNHKLTHILEIVWISLAVLSLVAGIYNWYKIGIEESYMFFIITFLSFLMFLYRRNLRKKRKP